MRTAMRLARTQRGSHSGHGLSQCSGEWSGSGLGIQDADEFFT